MNSEMKNHKANNILVIGVYPNEEMATRATGRLIDEDFPADEISLLQKSGGSGDDTLGLTYSSSGERVKIWSEQGALWGGLWGLLASATGLFVLPGIGPLLVAGPIVEAIGGAIAGAALTGGAMAGAAALTELGKALHNIGLSEEERQRIHQAIEDGHFVVILHCTPEQADQYSHYLEWAGAESVVEVPYEN